jgi:hypothetical protein
MAKTFNGTHISLKCFVPHGETVDEQIAVLTDLKRAQETGNYGALIDRAKLLDVHASPRRMRFEVEGGSYVVVEETVQTDIEDFTTPDGDVLSPRRKRA